MAETPLEDPDDERPLVKIASLVVLGVGLLALFMGYEWFWMVFALGFAVVVPLVKLATERLETDGARSDPTQRAPEGSTSKQDALDALRDRYARGDLTDEEFERKVERLLETESPESARDYVARESRSLDRETE